jgi:hypothetical protein
MSAGPLDRRKPVRELPVFVVRAMLHLWLMLC